MIVVDSSVMVDAVLGVPPADRVLDEELCAPHLIDAEVGHVLRRLARAGMIDERHAQSALLRMPTFEMLRYDHGFLLGRAWELRDNVSFYDALYVALAEALDAPLVTLDRALAGVPGSTAKVEVIPG